MVALRQWFFASIATFFLLGEAIHPPFSVNGMKTEIGYIGAP